MKTRILILTILAAGWLGFANAAMAQLGGIDKGSWPWNPNGYHTPSDHDSLPWVPKPGSVPCSTCSPQPPGSLLDRIKASIKSKLPDDREYEYEEQQDRIAEYEANKQTEINREKARKKARGEELLHPSGGSGSRQFVRGEKLSPAEQAAAAAQKASDAAQAAAEAALAEEADKKNGKKKKKAGMIDEKPFKKPDKDKDKDGEKEKREKTKKDSEIDEKKDAKKEDEEKNEKKAEETAQEKTAFRKDKSQQHTAYMAALGARMARMQNRVSQSHVPDHHVRAPRVEVRRR